ncbi:MAG TPA: exosortase/archaeosortase family protein [Fimbriimonadaceae bacterium]|nr:exosortase/archaeosortase family protein [Fimbriimonadaceae bacterium]
MSDVAEGVLPNVPLNAPAPKPSESGLSLAKIQTAASDFAKSDLFIPTIVLVAGLFLCFWPMLHRLPTKDYWLSDDGYYSHGFLIPFLSAYMIYLRWPRHRDTPAKPSLIAGIALAPLLWLAYAAQVSKWDNGSSLFFLLTLVMGTAFVAGWRWAKNLLGPILYLAFCLPMWSLVIDNFTVPLQQFSTVMATAILRICQLHPISGDNNVVYLDHFTLNIAVPCSGLKLLIAVTAFALLFIGISDLKWWGRVLMIAIALPLCIFINGFRIAMIGIVGDTWGDDAGHAFHDYSGYIALGVCFFILMKLTRSLGWK